MITKYVVESSFTDSDWYGIGQITGKLKTITEHPRLLRALSFGDDDYEYCAAQVLDSIFSSDSELIQEVIDHYDIDLWYQQTEPAKYAKIFTPAVVRPADFWKEGYVRLFLSHLSSNREKMSALKTHLADWGISGFVAHEDIVASREWRDEVEAGLETMEILAAIVEPGFKESDWCAQEIGYALGRKIDIIPLRAGLDPFGFFGKYQGIQIKGKTPEVVASEITKTLLKKPQHRNKLLQSMGKAFATLQSERKIKLILLVEVWGTVTDAQLKTLLEQASLSQSEKTSLRNLIARVGAFPTPAPATLPYDPLDDEIPF